MTDPVHEQLLGHLLGALDDSEQEEIQLRLEQQPELRREVMLWHDRLAPLEAARCDFPPPPGLAERTSRLVASRRVSPAPAGSARLAISPEGSSPQGTSRFRWQDVVTAAGVFVAASLLIIPAIQSSRFHSRVVTCQENLRQLGLALTRYSDKHADYFPHVPAEGNLASAGIYAPVLMQEKLLTEPRYVVCPSSVLAGQKRFRVPSLAELRSASRPRLVVLRRQMGGSYGYIFGHMRGGEYQRTKNLRRPFFAVMADAPSAALPGRQSTNHGGRGQNVLFEDRHVRFVSSSRPDPQADDFFTNDQGVVAPGVHSNDSVIGSSTAVPTINASHR